MIKKILLLNGPNLNMLGKREVEIYGKETLAEIITKVENYANSYGLTLEHFQSNIEGELVSKIQDTATDKIDAIIINAGAYSHTSIAIHDSLKIIQGKVIIIEVHLSNIHARESFRNHSYVSMVADGIIMGLGSDVYFLAIDAIKNKVG